MLNILYLYKYDKADSNITTEQGLEIAEAFARDLIQDGDKLEFRNEPAYSSRYDPGKRESFVAERSGAKYIITVNLTYGFWEFFIRES